MGYQQCLSLSVAQLKCKHCRNPHCRNGFVDTFGQVLTFLICILCFKENVNWPTDVLQKSWPLSLWIQKFPLMAMKSFTGKVSLDIFLPSFFGLFPFFNKKMGKCFQFHICYLILEKEFLFLQEWKCCRLSKPWWIRLQHQQKPWNWICGFTGIVIYPKYYK